MKNHTLKNTDSYTPQFSTRIGGKLIEDCLLAIEKDTPDMMSLLLSLNELAKLIQTVDYDHKILNNLIIENQLISQERDSLKLAQISQLVMNMETKLEKAEQDCCNLQSEINETELQKPKFSSCNGLAANLTLLKLAS